MSIDYGERERQFLETLQADSGRSLEAWMATIDAQGLTHRNDIIDWLRRQGFMFSKASWLERIHNNGGRPIYADAGTRRPQPRPRSIPPSRPLLTVVAPTPPPASPPPSSADASPAAIEALLARAKAFRPLAVYVIAEIRKIVPGIAVAARDGYLLFQAGARDAALLTIGTKELRLALSLESAPPAAALEPAKLPGLKGAPPMTHMTVLTDARQITPALLAAVAQATSGT